MTIQEKTDAAIRAILDANENWNEQIATKQDAWNESQRDNKDKAKPAQYIEPFKEGEPLTIARMNQIVKALNALLDIRLYRGAADKVFQSESNTVLQIWYNE